MFQNRSIKNKCEAFIYLRLSVDKQSLKITDLNLEHTYFLNIVERSVFNFLIYI